MIYGSDLFTSIKYLWETHSYFDQYIQTNDKINTNPSLFVDFRQTFELISMTFDLKYDFKTNSHYIFTFKIRKANLYLL